MRRNREAREVRDREAAQAIAARLDGVRIEVTARAGEGGKLFGSVTTPTSPTPCARSPSVEVDRRMIDLAEPVKELGAVAVPVRLHPDVAVELQVEVVAE